MAGAGAIGGGAIGITSNTDVYDKSGLKVSPNAINMQPPGNCVLGEQKKMQEEVNGWCKGKQTPTSCRGISSPAIRSAIAEVNRQCAIARDNINKQCFSGGDMTHRNQAIDAWNKYSECQ
jgi:type VI secretion system secreted protein VgrG